MIIIETKSGVRQSRLREKRQFRRKRIQPFFFQDPYQKSISASFYSPRYESLETEVRNDFRQTVFWQGQLKTDSKGKASLRFFNPDQASSFRISVAGMDRQGRLLQAQEQYHTQLPFAMNCIEPNWLSVGDNIMLPVQMQNNTNRKIQGILQVALPEGIVWESVESDSQQIELSPNSAHVHYLHLKVADIPRQKIEISFAAKAYRERQQIALSVRRQGFPFQIQMAGKKAEDSMRFALEDLVPGTVSASLHLYTDAFEELTSGAESILREPHGCFEQVSSSLYPNVLVLMLLKLSGNIRPGIKKKAINYIRKGYRKIKGYEISGGGFDLYGRPAAKMGLSAYGLMELRDMREVFPETSDALIARTRKYLLAQRDGMGGFRNGSKVGYYNSNNAVRNAYTVHALIEAGEDDLELELAQVRENALNKQDP
ncbi:MAG: alpha-2-macroglobulin family protein [Bacteroidota bacterium]